ncbi:MAG TPA: alpha/beta fold hydrolase [Candidatus Nitrosotalea sp.]|nr:alpha/beta fold hydrolase [Candidatus Nitrosotalea sp.]
MRIFARGFAVALVFPLLALGQQAAKYHPTDGDFVAHNFRFHSGEQLAEMRLHYRTLGQPARDPNGHITNAVLLLHGTGGSGAQFLTTQFADELFWHGQPLDLTRNYVIAPDGIGHGQSAKPSDGMHAHFPSYDYDDMVAAQHLLLTEGLGVQHLRLIFGTSMGCMHAFVWGETYPTFMDALMPMACLPVQIAGRNRLWRKMLMDAIRNDPDWNDGEYKEEPKRALRTAQDLLVIAGSAPVVMQKRLPTRDDADHYIADSVESRIAALDANDLLYQVNASRNYDPSPHLEDIVARVMWINSADDFINPPELGIAEKQSKRLKRGTFVLLPISDNTHGHGTHTWAVAWKDYMVDILNQSVH